MRCPFCDHDNRGTRQQEEHLRRARLVAWPSGHEAEEGYHA